MTRLILSFVALLSAQGAFAKDTAELGKPVKNLKMTDSNGKTHQISEFKGKTVVFEWLNYGCPFVRKHYDTGNMQNLQTEETSKGVVWLSVVTSAKGKQGYHEPKEMNEVNAKEGNKATATILDTK